MAESITLTPPHYDKLGNVLCGTLNDGTVTCAGDVAHLDDGQEHVFERVGIGVRRQGEEYVFTREQ